MDRPGLPDHRETYTKNAGGLLSWNLATHPGPSLGSHFAQGHHVHVRNIGRSGDGKEGCSALLLPGLILSFDLYLFIFLHPMRTLPYPLAFVLGTTHLQMMEELVS